MLTEDHFELFKQFRVSSNLSRYRQSPGLVPPVGKKRYRE